MKLTRRARIPMKLNSPPTKRRRRRRYTSRRALSPSPLLLLVSSTSPGQRPVRRNPVSDFQQHDTTLSSVVLSCLQQPPACAPGTPAVANDGLLATLPPRRPPRRGCPRRRGSGAEPAGTARTVPQSLSRTGRLPMRCGWFSLGQIIFVIVSDVQH